MRMSHQFTADGIQRELGREQPDAVVDSIPWIWLQCVGIDRSTNYRGVAVVPLEIADKVRNLNVAVYRPVTRSYKR